MKASLSFRSGAKPSAAAPFKQSEKIIKQPGKKSKPKRNFPAIPDFFGAYYRQKRILCFFGIDFVVK